MNRSPRKKEQHAIRQARRDPGIKSGFRSLRIGQLIFQWRAYHHVYKTRIIFPASTGVEQCYVTTWVLQEFSSREAWEMEHHGGGDGHERCGCSMVTPGMVRKYIDKMLAASK